jgi:hypothetical protein
MYLKTKFRPNRRIFVFWRPFWIKMYIFHRISRNTKCLRCLPQK